jgi:hypothetical protein
MARRKTKRRRAKQYFSLWDAGVAFGNLEILTRGSLGTGVVGFFTGEQDLAEVKSRPGWGTDLTTPYTIEGGEEISLGDIITEPSLAWGQVQANMKANAMSMAFSAITFNLGAKVLRRALRQPINQSNRYIRKLGMGVKI